MPMIRITHIEMAMVALLAIFGSSCNPRKGPAGQNSAQNNAQSVAHPLSANPTAPASSAPQTRQSRGSPDGGSPPTAAALAFSGEISRGRRFEKAVGPGLVFRLEPYAGNDSGWDIRLAPDNELSPASVDCIGAIEEPRHGSNELSLELQDNETDLTTELRRPREFEFVSTAADCKRAWDLSNSIDYDNGLSDTRRDELNRELGAVPTGHGQLQIVDARLSPSSAGTRPTAIDWIKFEVHLQFSQGAP